MVEILEMKATSTLNIVLLQQKSHLGAFEHG